MTEAEKQEKIRKIRKLIHQGTTPGEKAAARAALERMQGKTGYKSQPASKAFTRIEPITLHCKECQKRIRTHDPKQKYCSENCKKEARKRQDRARKQRQREENRKPEITYCRVCNRPLKDSYSIKIGIGPECRAGRTGRKFK